MSKQRVLPDAGKHLCTLVAVEEIENKFFDSKKDSEDKAKRLQWTFEYDDKKGMQIRVWSSANLSTYKGTMSNALRLVQALTDRELTKEETEKFDSTDELVGKKCFLDVKHQKQESGEVFAKVKDFVSKSGLPF